MTQQLGKYQLIKKLATGGMAEVWLARERMRDTERYVVLKRILPHLAEDPEFVQMFTNEYKLVFRFAQRITVMAGGRVVTEGAPAEIAKDARVRELYLGDAHV